MAPKGESAKILAPERFGTDGMSVISSIIRVNDLLWIGVQRRLFPLDKQRRGPRDTKT